MPGRQGRPVRRRAARTGADDRCDERSRVIETIMIFALGFLMASFCALLVLPAVNARAARLTQRRAAALFPLTSVEIAAEKDYLRAQFAVERRQLERKVQAVAASKHTDMAAIGARTLEAASLARTVTEREAAMAVKDGEIATALGERDRVAGNLEATQAELTVGVSTLLVLEDAHRNLLDDLLRARRQGDSAAIAGALVSDTETTTIQDAASTTGEPPAVDLQAQVATLSAERENLQAKLAAAEIALATAQAGAERENAALRDSISAVAEALVRGERLPSVGAFSMRAAAPDHG